MRRKIKIVPVDYGISSRYDYLIEINRKIKGNLKKRILAHELSHTIGSYSKKDYQVDYNAKNPYFLESLLFSFKNPEALVNFFPIMYSYFMKRWTFNLSSIFPFLLYSYVFSMACMFLFRIDILLAFLGFFNFIAILNIFLLIYTHFYVKLCSIKKKR